jgi:hypothetical protein
MGDRPIRIQRKRTKGWKLPPNTVSVTRPGKWGNPFPVEVYGAKEAVARHRVLMKRLMRSPSTLGIDFRESLEKLRGKNLACFCKLDQPCHADTLLALANSPTPTQSEEKDIE